MSDLKAHVHNKVILCFVNKHGNWGSDIHVSWPVLFILNIVKLDHRYSLGLKYLFYIFSMPGSLKIKQGTAENSLWSRSSSVTVHLFILIYCWLPAAWPWLSDLTVFLKFQSFFFFEVFFFVPSVLKHTQSPLKGTSLLSIAHTHTNS